MYIIIWIYRPNNNNVVRTVIESSHNLYDYLRQRIQPLHVLYSAKLGNM